MSGLLTEEEFFYQFPLIASPPFERPAGYPKEDSSIQGTVVAIYEVGAMIGSLLTLWKGDYLGRRTSMLAGSVTMLVGAITMTSSFSLGQFIVGRIIPALEMVCTRLTRRCGTRSCLPPRTEVSPC